MAEVLETFDFDKAKRRLSHSWDEWTDGRIYRVRKGVDFAGEVTSFLVTLRAGLKRRGMKVRANVQDDTVVFQAYRETEQ